VVILFGQDIKPKDFSQTFTNLDFLFICSPNPFVQGVYGVNIGGHISLYFKNYTFLKILTLHLPLEFGV
jgi:hypothetical protein